MAPKIRCERHTKTHKHILKEVFCHVSSVMDELEGSHQRDSWYREESVTQCKWILVRTDFKGVRIIDQGDSCVFSNETDHLLAHMLAHPTNRPVSLIVDSGRTARRPVEKMQNSTRWRPFSNRFQAPVSCRRSAVHAINAFDSTIVQPNSPSSCGHCLIPAPAVWLLFYLVGASLRINSVLSFDACGREPSLWCICMTANWFKQFTANDSN